MLQAARGLKSAHDAGMVHRDVKPDNLLLGNQGAVQVADLGLVKLLPGDGDDGPPEQRLPAAAALPADAGRKMAGSAMGTPDFMAPEQAESAADVDHRGDIHALGCTLYTLLTGKPPFSGTTIREVITKHKTEPVPRLDKVLKGAPQALADLTSRMTAKRPDQRCSSLDEVIEELSAFLGISSNRGAGFSPREDQVRTVQQCADSFLAANKPTPQDYLGGGVTGVCILLALAGALSGAPWPFGTRGRRAQQQIRASSGRGGSSNFARPPVRHRSGGSRSDG